MNRNGSAAVPNFGRGFSTAESPPAKYWFQLSVQIGAKHCMRLTRSLHSRSSSVPSILRSGNDLNASLVAEKQMALLPSE